MKTNSRSLLKCIALPLLLAGLSWLLSRNGISEFQYFIEPPLSPAPKIFIPVWLILSVSMGIASYLIHQADTSHNSRFEALFLYHLQLGSLFLWSVFFYRFHFFFVSFIWLLFIWAILWMTIQSFYVIRKSAGLLLLPYLLWISLYGYLNLLLSLLN